MKTTTANTFVEVRCNCPECDDYIDVFDQVKEAMENLRAENCELEVVCPECKKLFIITEIFY